jgi:ATP phosphoribosyltransferase
LKKVRIALTKGRLEEHALETFKSIGVDIRELQDKGRKLIFTCENEEYNIDFFLVKAPDVTTYVEYGAADIGNVGKDTLMEINKEFYEVLDLKVGKCRFAVAALPEFKLEEGYNRKKIATKYPNVAENILEIRP